MIKKLFKTEKIIKLRNFFSISPTFFNINYLEKNISISDGFFWRVDDNFSTIFKFTNLIKFYFNKESNVEIFFFDNNHNYLNQIALNTKNYSEEYIITKKIVKNINFGVFYIFHRSNTKIDSILRNSCYVGYSYKNSLYSYVHGNTPSAKKNISDNFSKLNYDLLGSSIFKKKYVVQKKFNNKTEAMILNSTPIDQTILINEEKIFLKKGHSYIHQIKDKELLEINSKCYLLRPIVFEYDKDFLNVYHG